jgi:hypothetical protein
MNSRANPAARVGARPIVDSTRAFVPTRAVFFLRGISTDEKVSWRDRHVPLSGVFK